MVKFSNEGVRFSAIALSGCQRQAKLRLVPASRALSTAPKLAVADGALGFWKAIGEIWPKTGEQRCWVHKTANIPQQAAWQEPAAWARPSACCKTSGWPGTNKDAEAAFDAFVETYAVKCEKAVECLKKDREPRCSPYLRLSGRTLETPAHVRSQSKAPLRPVRHRTIRSKKGCLSNKTRARHGVQASRRRAEDLGVALTATTSCQKSFEV